MKHLLSFILGLVVCLTATAQRSQTITRQTPVSGGASSGSGTPINATPWATTNVLNVTSPEGLRTAANIVPLEGGPGILAYSSNKISLDTTLYVQTTIDSTNHVLDAAKFKPTLTATNDIYFLHATNLFVGAPEGSLRIIAGTTNRLLRFPTTWVNLGAAAPTSIASNKVGLLAWQAYGTNQTDIVYGYAVQP
jgi:hypothetical protein